MAELIITQRSGQRHSVEPSDVDERDERSGDEQLCLVWCNTHRSYEWHWIPAHG